MSNCLAPPPPTAGAAVASTSPLLRPPAEHPPARNPAPAASEEPIASRREVGPNGPGGGCGWSMTKAPVGEMHAHGGRGLLAAARRHRFESLQLLFVVRRLGRQLDAALHQPHRLVDFAPQKPQFG